MNAGPISNGVSHKHGDACRADLEEIDILADVESYDHDSRGPDGDAFYCGMDADQTSSAML